MQLTPENFKLFISVKKDTFPTKISCLDTTYKSKHCKGGGTKTLSLEKQLILNFPNCQVKCNKVVPLIK